MSLKSLKELAIMACLKNIRDIDNIGFLSYEVAREILIKVDNPAQLRQIELNSPHIEGQTGEIWLKFIERDFPLESKTKAYQPRDPKKWYKIWEKYKVEHDKALQESENKLKFALAGLRQDKEKNTSKIVSGKALPSSAKFAIRRYTGPREGSSNALMFGGGSRTKTANGASVMRKVRREVKEIANIHGSLSRTIKAPSRHPTVMKAPAAMINDRKRAAQPAYRPVPKEPAKISPLEAALEEFERRATYLSDSEENDDDDDNEDALPKETHARSKQFASAASTSAVKAASRAPTSALQRKFGGFKPSAPAAPVVQKASTSRPAESPQKRQAHTLPETRSSPPMDEGSSPQSVEELLTAVDAQQAATAGPAPPRKRKAVDIFMRPKRRA
ncbi:rna polymerase ii transcription factor siii, subunit a [Trichoderma arundinaceum]|uniref:Rna polymerase ii transcription factor siii, subunit a n=1 Tax=Trichoderma arundinaceum TaxID=490622 RepID=A0A395NDT3_TRIAR|nr:rna polymerase ii transcription factor siii, subunit a [Trichoderma arundinaceum]